MTVTLQPVLEALGYADAKQQRALVKLLQAAGAFGDVQGVDGMLTDQQADAILTHLTFSDATQAATALHDITQQHLISRSKKPEPEPAHFQKHHAGLMQALQDTGMLNEVKPQLQHYDHVLVPGAMEAETVKRFDYLKLLAAQGVRFDKIHLLGGERELHEKSEPSTYRKGPGGKTVFTEMDMMESRYYDPESPWPDGLEKARVFEVNTYNKPDGTRANTQDTIKSWIKTNPVAGNVLVISSQPYAKYQDAAVKSVLPPQFHVETVGAAAPADVSIRFALDTLARQIDVGFPKLLEKLQAHPSVLATPLIGVDPATVKVDAATYQFRANGDANGVTDKGRYHADHWDPILHGDPILVHERLDGSLYVADGHHRLELAKELNAKGVGPGNILAMVLSEKQGYTAKDAKIIAAYKNIAHGQTDPVETARVFKEAYSGQVHMELLPSLQMDKGNLRMSFTMARLSDKVLDRVAAGEVTPQVAAKLAEYIPTDHNRQESVMRIICDKLHQKYETPGNSHPTMVQVKMFDLAKDQEAKLLPGFVEKLAQQRAKNAVLGLSC